MGIRNRNTAALIALFLFVGSAHASTIRNVNVPPPGNVINNTTYSFQTPNGDAGYFGRDFVDRHQAGNRFSGGGGNLNYNGPDGRVSVTLKPVVTAKPSTVASRAVGILRSNPAQIAASAAVGLMLDHVGAFIEDNQVMVPSVQEHPVDSTHFRWNYGNRPDWGEYPSAQSACEGGAAYQGNTLKSCVRLSETEFRANMNDRFGNPMQVTVFRRGNGCPSEYTYDSQKGACLKGGLNPATDQDFSTMHGVARGFDPGYLRDLITASCEGSSSPSACYDDLLDQAPLDGPATQTPPSTSTSTTTTNPDGSTTTTNTSTSNSYSYTYSPTSYTYTTTTTTTTTHPDGSQTTETVTDAQPEGEEPSREEEADPTYTDTDFPEVEPFYEQQYPDGIEGIWEARKAELDQSEFVAFLQSFVPSFSGSCPSFSLNLNVMTGSNFGIHNFPSLCYVFDFIKVILLVTAVFTARALIFGG